METAKKKKLTIVFTSYHTKNKTKNETNDERSEGKKNKDIISLL